jgi:hypothetical protein
MHTDMSLDEKTDLDMIKNSKGSIYIYIYIYIYIFSNYHIAYQRFTRHLDQNWSKTKTIKNTSFSRTSMGWRVLLSLVL